MYAQFARTLSRPRHEKGGQPTAGGPGTGGCPKRRCPTMKTGFGSLAWPLWSELAITTKSQQTTCWGGRTSRGGANHPPSRPGGGGRRPAGRALPGAVPPRPASRAILSRWAGELAQGAGEKPAAPPRKSKAVKV